MTLVEEFADGSVADRGGLGDAEDGGQVKWVEGDGECFFKLPVDPLAFDSGRQLAQVQHERVADRVLAPRGLCAEQQVRVGGVLSAALDDLQDLKYTAHQIWGHRHGPSVSRSRWVWSDRAQPPVFVSGTFTAAYRASGTPAIGATTGPSRYSSARTAA